MKTYDLKNTLVDALALCAKKHHVQKLVLFGSRARSTNHEKSDIDLAVYGGDVVNFALEIEEEVPTLLKFDVVDITGYVQPEFAAIVAQEGVVLYEEV
jgi:predicted nucleotidyltransferase